MLKNARWSLALIKGFVPTPLIGKQNESLNSRHNSYILSIGSISLYTRLKKVIAKIAYPKKTKMNNRSELNLESRALKPIRTGSLVASCHSTGFVRFLMLLKKDFDVKES